MSHAICQILSLIIPSVKYRLWSMDLLPDTENCGLRIRRKSQERFPCRRLQRKLLVSDPGMHHGTCVTHVPWWMSGWLISGGVENIPSIPSACATRNFTYLARGPCHSRYYGSNWPPDRRQTYHRGKWISSLYAWRIVTGRIPTITHHETVTDNTKMLGKNSGLFQVAF